MSTSKSSEYRLPTDLQVRHIRSCQTIIRSDQTTRNDKARIERVKVALQRLGDDEPKDTTDDGDNNTDVNIDALNVQLNSLNLDPNDPNFVNKDSNSNIDTSINMYLSPEEEKALLDRYKIEFVEEKLKPFNVPASTPIAVPIAPANEFGVFSPRIDSIIEVSSNLVEKQAQSDVAEGNDKLLVSNFEQNNPESTPPTSSLGLTLDTSDATMINNAPEINLGTNLKRGKVFSNLIRQRKLGQFIHAINAIKEARNIVVITGAGISVPAGIPDFRSENGLYSLLNGIDLNKLSIGNNNFTPSQKQLYSPQNLARSMHEFEPNQLFSMDFFPINPVPFYTFYYKMLNVSQSSDPNDQNNIIKPTFTHEFIRLLDEHGKLRRVYTQNIDNLEKKVGLGTDKFIACHGNDASFYCLDCKFEIETKYIQPWLEQHKIPFCSELRQWLYNTYYDIAVEEEKANRSSPVKNHDDKRSPFTPHELKSLKRNKQKCNGLWKPRIVFFGESLPPHFFTTLKQDVGNCDLVLIMGTSLQVSPVATLPGQFSTNKGRLGEKSIEDLVTRCLTNGKRANVNINTEKENFKKCDQNEAANNEQIVDQNIVDENDICIIFDALFKRYFLALIKSAEEDGSDNNTDNEVLDDNFQYPQDLSTRKRQWAIFPLKHRKVLYNTYILHRYTKIVSNNDTGFNNLNKITRNLEHVPIISINRDALLSMGQYGHTSISNPYFDTNDDQYSEANADLNRYVPTTKAILEFKLGNLFRTKYFLNNIGDNNNNNTLDNTDLLNDLIAQSSPEPNTTVIPPPLSPPSAGSQSDGKSTQPLVRPTYEPYPDDLSDGDYNDWCIDENYGKENNTNDCGGDENGEVGDVVVHFSTPQSRKKPKPTINTTPTPHLNRCDYEFLGNADDITQFIVKELGW